MTTNISSAGGLPDIRVGIGHDTHRLEIQRNLILGGIAFDHARGLAGHSDADIVLHAVTDAILGAAGLGDIGDWFPDGDPANFGAESTKFLAVALEQAGKLGWRPGNLDVIIFAQEPKLGPGKLAIRDNLARLLCLESYRVNVKAKTGERVGHIGRAEAMSCQAVVLLVRG